MITLPTAAGATTEYEDFYETTLAAPVGASDTDIYPTTMPNSAIGFLVIDPLGANPEIIFYNVKGANYVRVPSNTDGEGRGVGTTSPRAFDSGTKIGMYSIAEFYEGIVTGKFMRDGFLQSRHFSSSIDPNSWIGTGETWNYVGSNGQKEFQYVVAGDKTSKYTKGMKLRIPRPTALGTQSAQFLKASTQYASKAAPSGYGFTTKFTIQAKVFLYSYPTSNATIAARWDGSSGLRMDIDSGGTVTVRGDNAGNEKNGNGLLRVPLNQWVTITGTLDMTLGSNWGAVYHDGIAIAVNQNTAGSPTAIVQAGNLQIGAGNGTTLPFDGLISEVSIWSDVLTPAYISANYNKQLVGNEANLVSYYKLNGNFNDTTGNANNLTAVNGAIATYADNPFKSIEYAFLTGLSYSAGNTTITVWGGRDYIMPAENLTGVSYSAASQPVGFPAVRGRWSIQAAFGTTFSGTATSTWENVRGFRLRAPMGDWAVIGRPAYQVGGAELYSSISTSNTAPTEHELTVRDYDNGSATIRLRKEYVRKDMSFATATDLYMITKSGSAYDIRGDWSTPHVASIEIESAYV